MKGSPEERKKHTFAVRDTAVKLAERYGADEKKAEIAALFHDIKRSASDLEHGKMAALVMERDYGIDDEDILNAVRYHTTGRPGMSLLEKIIFIADAIEPGRSYPGAEKIREAAFSDIDRACILSMENTIRYIKKTGRPLDGITAAARDHLKKKEKVMDSKKIAEFSAKALDQKKALHVLMVDVGEKSSFADFFVMASGSSERQIGALSDEVREKLEKEGITAKNIEGKPSSGWILMDYGDVIINILTLEMRERYNIEKVWGDCEITHIGEENAK